MTGKLTVAEVRTLRAKGKYLDGHGLILNVVAPGQRYWMFRYKRDGRERTMSLGHADVTGLAEARNRHAEARALLARGVDPLGQREQAKQEKAASVSFQEAAAAYIAAHRAGWRGKRAVEQWTNSLATYAAPYFGTKPVGEVTRDDVLAALGPIWTAKAVTAAILRNRIELVLDYAQARGWRQGENPARWKGGLKMLLPAKAKFHTTVHRPALPWQEAPGFLAQLTADGSMAARCLAFCIMTGARSGEARGCRWSELDMTTATWTIPASRMKAAKQHRIALSKPAMAILRELAEVRTGDLVFFGRRGARLADTTLRDLLQQLAPGTSVHGFRATFSTWAADTGKDGMLVESALAHTVGTPVARAYQRSDLLEARRPLMAAWARFLLPTEAVVVPLQPAAA
jgi:integrase